MHIVNRDPANGHDIAYFPLPSDPVRYCRRLVTDIVEMICKKLPPYSHTDFKEKRPELDIETRKIESVEEDMFRGKKLFIHGTNSKSFKGLELTDFELTSPMKLLERHKVSPLTGEVTGGGLSIPECDCSIRLGRLDASCGYTLEKVITSYSHSNDHTHPDTEEATLDRQMTTLNWLVSDSPKKLSSNINEILVILGRIRVLGGDLKLLLNDNAKIYTNINDAINYFYFLLIVAKHFSANPAIRGSEESDKHYNHVYNMTSYMETPELLKSLRAFDGRALLESGNIEDINSVCNLFRLPESETPTFLVREVPLKTKKRATGNNFLCYGVKNCGEVTIHNLLTSMSRGSNSEYHTDQALRSQDAILKHIDVLKEKRELLESLKECPLMAPKEVASRQHLATQKEIPLVFLKPEDESIRVVDYYFAEYELTQPARIGKDIIYVATDTAGHQKLLEDYIDSKKLHLITCRFDDLRYLRDSACSEAEFKAYLSEKTLFKWLSLKAKKYFSKT